MLLAPLRTGGQARTVPISPISKPQAVPASDIWRRFAHSSLQSVCQQQSKYPCRCPVEAAAPASMPRGEKLRRRKTKRRAQEPELRRRRRRQDVGVHFILDRALVRLVCMGLPCVKPRANLRRCCWSLNHSAPFMLNLYDFQFENLATLIA